MVTTPLRHDALRSLQGLLGGVAIPAAAILATPTLGRSLTWQSGVLNIADTAWAATLAFIAALLLATCARYGINRHLDHHVPGRLIAPTAPAMPAVITKALVIVTAALYAATHAHGDHGATGLVLALAGAVSLALIPACFLATHDAPQDRRRIVFASIARHALLGIGCTAVAYLAPSGPISDTATEIARSTGLIVMLVALLATAAGSARRGGPRQGDDALQALATRAVDATVAAPTITHYQRGHQLLSAALVWGTAMAVLTLPLLP